MASAPTGKLLCMEHSEDLREIAIRAYGREPKRNKPEIVLEIGIKHCYVCKEWKRVEEFGIRSRSADGRNTKCLSCDSKYMEEWRKAHPSKRRAYTVTRTKRRAADPELRLRKRCNQYGITVEQYKEAYERQGGRCAVCRRPEVEGKQKLSIDHDHSCCPSGVRACGKCFRGLLCVHCNSIMVGYFENKEVIEKVSRYLGRNVGMPAQTGEKPLSQAND